jgi:glutathione S-transferase
MRVQGNRHMQDETITLYTYATSPYGAKVYWALIYKRVEFDIVYVSPLNQKEIKFTNQKVVPVLKVGSEWRLDSTPLCLWLEELCPSPSFAGNSEQEKRAIQEAHEWVTHNLIALGFRLMADDQMRSSAFKAGRKLVQTLRQTPAGVPWAFQFVWSTVLRQVAFIKRDAAMTDLTKPFWQVRPEIMDELNDKLTRSAYIAGTEQPSYADIAAFSRIATATEHNIEELIRASDTPAIQSWFERMLAAMPETYVPPLVPGQQPRFLTTR